MELDRDVDAVGKLIAICLSGVLDFAAANVLLEAHGGVEALGVALGVGKFPLGADLDARLVGEDHAPILLQLDAMLGDLRRGLGGLGLGRSLGNLRDGGLGLDGGSVGGGGDEAEPQRERGEDRDKGGGDALHGCQPFVRFR